MDMQIMAWLAAALVFASFFMKTIVPLRALSIGSNIVFICYALLGIHYRIFDKVLHHFGAACFAAATQYFSSQADHQHQPFSTDDEAR